MTTGLHDRGEELYVRLLFTQDVALPTTLTVGVYDDSTDQLGEADDFPISTEPSDGSYARLSYTLGTDFTAGTNAGGDWMATFAEKEFNFTNTTGRADAFFYAAEFQADGDTEPTNHIISSGRMTDPDGNPTSDDLGTTETATFDGTFTFE